MFYKSFVVLTALLASTVLATPYKHMKCHHFGGHEHNIILDQTADVYDSQYTLPLPRDAAFIADAATPIDLSTFVDFSITFWLVLDEYDEHHDNVAGNNVGNIVSIGSDNPSFNAIYDEDLNIHTLAVTYGAVSYAAPSSLPLAADGQTWNFISATFSNTWGGMKVSFVGASGSFQSVVVPGTINVPSNSDQIIIPGPGDSVRGYLKGLRMWNRMLSNSELSKIVSQGPEYY